MKRLFTYISTAFLFCFVSFCTFAQTTAVELPTTMGVEPEGYIEALATKFGSAYGKILGYSIVLMVIGLVIYYLKGGFKKGK